MSESVERVSPATPTDVTDGLTKNLQQTEPSLTSSDARARIRKSGLTYSAHCIDPKHPDCHWTTQGPTSDREAERHPHATVTEVKPG